MSKDEIQKVTLGTNEALRVTAEGEFIWHPEADAMIEYGDFTSSPAMRHILRALRKALAAPMQVFDHVTAARQGLRDAQNRSRRISNLINCGTCGYPLTPEERTSLIERDGVMVRPTPVQEPVAWKWHQAPVKTSWGHDMVVADLAIDKDNTVSVYCERDQTAKVEAIFIPPAAPDLQAELDATNRQVEILSDALAESRRQRQWVGLTDEEIQAEWLLTPQHDKAEGVWFGRRLEAKLKEKNT
jgi:hypothetical protein